MQTKTFLKFAGLICVSVLICQTSFSEEGKFRKRIRERMLERMDDTAAPKADTDTRSAISNPGDYTYSISFGGMTRYYKAHVPAHYQPGTPAPLLVALHGGGGNMEYQATDKYYGLISKSDKEGFIAVFPNGFSWFKSGKLATWNAGKCCGGARNQNVDDVGFIRQIIDNVTHQFNIDRRKIFATGMSNGGMMAQRLACEMSDVFKAVAPVAGTDNTKSCSPQKPISILEIHAKDDDHVLFNGGAGPGVQDKSNVTEFTSVPETISRWVKRNGCDTKAKRVLDKPGAYCDSYSQCKGGVEVRLCVTETGGHSWSGGKKVRGGEKQPSNAIVTDDVMWDFFNR